MTGNKKLLLEELTQPGGQYNQWSKSPAGTQENPKRVNLIDLINYQKEQSADLAMAPNVLPFPLTKNVVEQIGDIYVQATKIQSELGQSYNSPLISDSKEASDTIKNIFKKLEKVKLVVKAVTEDLKKLDIE